MKNIFIVLLDQLLHFKLSNLQPILGYTNTISFKYNGTTMHLPVPLMQREQCLITSAQEFIIVLQTRFSYLFI